MVIVIIQGVALLIQCVSAVLAIRLIRVTGRYAAWLLIALSIVLIVARRAISYGRLLLGDLSGPPAPDVLTESVILLAISVVQAAGIMLIAPLFQAMVKREEELVSTNVEIERQVNERTQALVEQHARLEQAFARLREAEASRDGLTHMIVHDLRTPLSSVYGFLTTIERHESSGLSESGREFLQIAIDSTRSLGDMVTSLLDVSRMESGRMELDLTTWDPVAVFTGVLEGLAPLQGGRSATVQTPELPLTVTADARLIARVMQNLIGNAFKFSQDDARIEIAIKSTSGGVEVSVSDNGPGIPPEHHERIFEKFSQLQDAGRQPYSTGLGLAFCKLAVEAHGGRIWVESEVGKGSTFRFLLPAHPRASAASGQGSAGGTAASEPASD